MGKSAIFEPIWLKRQQNYKIYGTARHLRASYGTKAEDFYRRCGQQIR
ncbi:MAG: hypothetical protein JSW23_01835 [Planctomycetota bacterium]|nr:MAG: hypothetical protein JSW23_01835 [Planctomycetota bacterium]